MDVKLLVCGIIVVVTVTGLKAQLEDCGEAPLNTRIVGGTDAPAGAWPWQVSLHSGGVHFCGGTLITEQWILSAAHCVSSTSTFNVIVYLGRETQQLVNENEVSRTVSQIIIHQGYDDQTQDNDISLLQLSSPVTFTDYIRPVCLAAEGSVIEVGLNCWVTGWGRIQTGVPLPFPESLQEVIVPIASDSDCRDIHSDLTSNMICAGLEEGGKDSCQGDSGGPLVSKYISKWVQIGVVSFGINCAEPNSPGVYTRLTEYQSWINSFIASPKPGFITFGVDNSTSGTAQLVSSLVPLLLSIIPVLFSVFILS